MQGHLCLDPLNFPAGKIQGHFLVRVEVRVGVGVRAGVQIPEAAAQQNLEDHAAASF